MGQVINRSVEFDHLSCPTWMITTDARAHPTYSLIESSGLFEERSLLDDSSILMVRFPICLGFAPIRFGSRRNKLRVLWEGVSVLHGAVSSGRRAWFQVRQR